MKYKRGDVVLVNFPFASGVGSKVRPAVIVQCDRNNKRLDNTIIAQITSRLYFSQKEPTQMLVLASSSDGRQMGLLLDSALSCENLFTVRQDTIQRKIGHMPNIPLKELDVCLKASLELF
jgi:mRNA-degrading endonuclease toxin of MazEF toxin-antitoxin module